MSDLLPALDGAYSIGNAIRRWVEANFYFDDSGGPTGLWSGARIGAKIPSDDPDIPNYPLPHVDLSILPGVGAADDYRITVDSSDFQFIIQRRILGSGSWIPIMKFNGLSDPPQWQFGASFLPTLQNTYDFGADTLRWRDLFLYRYIAIFGFTSTLPTPSILTTNRLTARTPASGATEAYFCRRRTAGDYKWMNLTDSFESIALLKDVAGITRAGIGTSDVEILGAAHRSKVDLTYMDRCRVVFGGENSEASVFYCKIQYSTDELAWYDLTPEAASNGNAVEQLVVGAWGSIPADALADVFVRAVGRASNGDANPTYKSIELQVR